MKYLCLTYNYINHIMVMCNINLYSVKIACKCPENYPE